MCGGVIFPYKKEYREALEQYYSPEEVDEFERTGQVRSLYWQRGEPVLPVEAPAAGAAEEVEEDAAESEPAATAVMRWGNRDKAAPFPQTGWARADSLESGKWSYLRPEPVVIPVTHGVEKGKWFRIDNGILGVVVQAKDKQSDGQPRVYMLTDEATPEYLSVTGHARMPVLQDQTTFEWLEGDPADPGMDSAR